MFTNRFEQFIHLYWVLRAHVSWRGARNGPTQFEIQVSAAQNTDMKGKHRKKYDFLSKSVVWRFLQSSIEEKWWFSFELELLVWNLDSSGWDLLKSEVSFSGIKYFNIEPGRLVYMYTVSIDFVESQLQKWKKVLYSSLIYV